jgi:hypothetical protein
MKCDARHNFINDFDVQMPYDVQTNYQMRLHILHDVVVPSDESCLVICLLDPDTFRDMTIRIAASKMSLRPY